jgi:antitoxin component YwqK of YwqJK toxin-antitoxin module
MRTLLLSLIACLLWSACQTGDTSPETPNLEGFTVEKMPGTDFKMAQKFDDDRLVEEGMLFKGEKTGTWITYHGDRRNFPKIVANYAGGVLNGPYMEFNQYGQFEVVAHYRNNRLHGRVSKYKVTRLVEELTYKEGVLDGPYTLFYENSDFVQRTAEFKDGKEHGTIRYFNENGEVTMQYEYRNGEKISGGMVE